MIENGTGGANTNLNGLAFERQTDLAHHLANDFNGRYEMCIRDSLKAVLDGEINPGKVFTKTFTLDQIQDAYKAMDDRQVIKSYVVID